MKYLYQDNEQGIKNSFLVSQQEIYDMFDFWEKVYRLGQPPERGVPILILGVFSLCASVTVFIPTLGEFSVSLLSLLMLVGAALGILIGVYLLIYAYYFYTSTPESRHKARNDALYQQFLKQGQVVEGKLLKVNKSNDGRSTLIYSFPHETINSVYVTRSPNPLQPDDVVAVLYVKSVGKSILL